MFRRVVCTGLPYSMEDRWYDCSAITALNMLAGHRLSANLHDHLKSANAPRNESQMAAPAGLLVRGGWTNAPYL